MEIYNKYSSENDPNFAVLYQPANINILGFPIEALKYACLRRLEIIINVLTRGSFLATLTTSTPQKSLINGLPR